VKERHTNLVERIAAAAECSNESVEQILNDFGLNLTANNRRHRSIRLDRLRIRGTKVGEIEPGPFDETFLFDLGVTVIAANNLRGKTSILELLTFILRGEPRNLQSDVLSWLDEISLDLHINGQSLGFRLSLLDSEIYAGRILSGTPTSLQASDDVVANDVAELVSVENGDEWATQVGAFMMNQLSLEEMQVFNKARNDDEAGIIKSHGWPSYFGVLYPPSGADTILLGSTAGDQLPVRLMQVFLDMPEATRSMRVRALAQRLDSEFKAEQRRGRDTDALIARQLQGALKRRSEAEERMKDLRDQEPAESLQMLSDKAHDAGQAVAKARQMAEAATVLFEEAQVARISDEKALNALQESKAASALFHGLNPKSCPRCEHPISSQRRSRENDEHHCAVCDTELRTEDEDDYAEREQQVIEALAATRAAEKSLDAARNQAQVDLDLAQKDLVSIGERISRAEGARQVADRAAAEQELAAAVAVVDALQAMAPKEAEPPMPIRVLIAASEILKTDIAKVSTALYTDLSNATRDLALAFGIGQLENIKIKRNGTMDVTKGGGARSSFSAQSPGERLRLRYALVVALLRTARIRNIAGHPGLLLLDSLKAEEVQEDHAQTLLQGLVDSAAEEPGLQILVTTADRKLAASVSGVAGTIEPKPNRTTLF